MLEAFNLDINEFGEDNKQHKVCHWNNLCISALFSKKQNLTRWGKFSSTRNNCCLLREEKMEWERVSQSDNKKKKFQS